MTTLPLTGKARLVALSIALIGFILGIVVTDFGVKGVIAARQSLAWPKTRGVIVRSWVETRATGTRAGAGHLAVGGRQETAHVTYEFNTGNTAIP